jgi:hypothetical protein
MDVYGVMRPSVGPMGGMNGHGGFYPHQQQPSPQPQLPQLQMHLQQQQNSPININIGQSMMHPAHSSPMQSMQTSPSPVMAPSGHSYRTGGAQHQQSMGGMYMTRGPVPSPGGSNGHMGYYQGAGGGGGVNGGGQFMGSSGFPSPSSSPYPGQQAPQVQVQQAQQQFQPSQQMGFVNNMGSMNMGVVHQSGHPSPIQVHQMSGHAGLHSQVITQKSGISILLQTTIILTLPDNFLVF